MTLGPSRELLYSSPSCPFSPLEVSVVYHRAGYELAEYDDRGISARLLLEKSLAIKCPSVLSHLTTFKKVQQHLASPGVLERFLSPAQVLDIRSIFAPLYPLDESESGLRARQLASRPESARNHILKPSLEGGGHNVYGEEIPQYLNTVPKELWHTYILMERINSPSQLGMLLSSEGFYEGRTLSELGIVGTCMWRQGESKNIDILDSRQVGWTFKTKPEEVEEMSVVKGYGFFDSPHLVED